MADGGSGALPTDLVAPPTIARLGETANETSSDYASRWMRLQSMLADEQSRVATLHQSQAEVEQSLTDLKRSMAQISVVEHNMRRHTPIASPIAVPARPAASYVAFLSLVFDSPEVLLDAIIIDDDLELLDAIVYDLYRHSDHNLMHFVELAGRSNRAAMYDALVDLCLERFGGSFLESTLGRIVQSVAEVASMYLSIDRIGVVCQQIIDSVLSNLPSLPPILQNVIATYPTPLDLMLVQWIARHLLEPSKVDDLVGTYPLTPIARQNLSAISHSLIRLAIPTASTRSNRLPSLTRLEQALLSPKAILPIRSPATFIVSLRTSVIRRFMDLCQEQEGQCAAIENVIASMPLQFQSDASGACPTEYIVVVSPFKFVQHDSERPIDDIHQPDERQRLVRQLFSLLSPVAIVACSNDLIERCPREHRGAACAILTCLGTSLFEDTGWIDEMIEHCEQRAASVATHVANLFALRCIILQVNAEIVQRHDICFERILQRRVLRIALSIGDRVTQFRQDLGRMRRSSRCHVGTTNILDDDQFVCRSCDYEVRDRIAYVAEFTRNALSAVAAVDELASVRSLIHIGFDIVDVKRLAIDAVQVRSKLAQYVERACYRRIIVFCPIEEQFFDMRLRILASRWPDFATFFANFSLKGLRKSARTVPFTGLVEANLTVAVKAIRNVSLRHCPSDKYECLVQCRMAIVKILQIYRGVDTDGYLAVLAFVIVKAKPRSFLSELLLVCRCDPDLDGDLAQRKPFIDVTFAVKCLIQLTNEPDEDEVCRHAIDIGIERGYARDVVTAVLQSCMSKPNRFETLHNLLDKLPVVSRLCDMGNTIDDAIQVVKQHGSDYSTCVASLYGRQLP